MAKAARVDPGVMTSQARAAMSHSAFCGLSEEHLGELVAELAPRWEARCESGRHERRGSARRREAGAGPKYDLVFVDRLLATLVHLRTGLTHAALGVIYEVGSSTIGRAVGEIRPLLAERGFAVPERPLRLRTLEDVFAYAEAENVTLRIDGMETQVRRPKAGRPGRRAFVSGKRRQNTIKTTTISDGQGRTLWSGATRPGRMHDQTAMRTEGIAEQFRQHPGVKAEVDDGYRGLANEFPEQVSAPPKKPKEHEKDDAPLSEKYGWREMKRRQSSRRICVEHANAEHRQWRPLQRYTGRRETYAETHRAVAGLVSDRAARRTTRRKPSTELVLARPTAC
ncbi:transposase family protein [Streptomyces chiangmaiensis]